jgi:hypothetical protein
MYRIDTSKSLLPLTSLNQVRIKTPINAERIEFKCTQLLDSPVVQESENLKQTKWSLQFAEKKYEDEFLGSYYGENLYVTTNELTIIELVLEPLFSFLYLSNWLMYNC